MLRITKITDYAIVVLGTISSTCRTARDIARATRIPPPTVSKVLKLLTRGEVVVSERGAKGGYRLTRHPHEVSLADIIDAVEGPIGVTECSTHATSCEFEGSCPMEANWVRINDIVRRALAQVSLAEMSRSTREPLISLGTSDAARNVAD